MLCLHYEINASLLMSCFELILGCKDTTFQKINHELRRLRELFIGTIPTQQFNESSLQQKSRKHPHCHLLLGIFNF